MKRMVVIVGLFLLMLSVTVFAPFGSIATAAGDGAKYAGMDSCKECHTDKYNTFKKSGHPYKLNKVVDGKPPKYPFTTVSELPKGVTWDDVSYVIGGYNWKYRFVGKDGFIITGSSGDKTFRAVGNAKKFTGDIRTHMMAIDYDQMGQFSKDGKTALSQLGLNFACKSCHYEGGKAKFFSDKDLRETAFNYHERPSVLPTDVPSREE